MLQQKQANKQMNNFKPLLQLVSGYPCYLFPELFQEATVLWIVKHVVGICLSQNWMKEASPVAQW